MRYHFTIVHYDARQWLRLKHLVQYSQKILVEEYVQRILKMEQNVLMVISN